MVHLASVLRLQRSRSCHQVQAHLRTTCRTEFWRTLAIWILTDSNVQLRHLWIPTSVRSGNNAQSRKAAKNSEYVGCLDSNGIGTSIRSDPNLDVVRVFGSYLSTSRAGKRRQNTDTNEHFILRWLLFSFLLSQFSRPSNDNKWQPFANCRMFPDAILASVAVSGIP